jgi:AbrB family looped-hinge helix DNA binding protein
MELLGTSELRARARLGEKGRFVIPAAMRQALGVDAGGTLELRFVDGELRVSSIRSRIQRVQARARQLIPPGVSLADELSAERREAAKHE